VPSAAKSAVAPAYLFACLILGGSAQGIWQNLILQLLGVAIITWAATSGEEPLPKRARTLLLILVAALALVLLQLVPLPSSFWGSGVWGRIVNGYAVLGQQAPWLPVSLSPYASLDSLFAIIPPLAVLCAILRLGAFRASWLAAALLAGGVAGIALGALQVVAPGPASPWYLYQATNRGVAVGFFANANHMADLLVVTLPFVAALAAAGRTRNIQRYSALLAVLSGAAVLLVVGIALNGSLAGYALAVPAIAASVLIVSPAAARLRMPIAALTLIALVAAVGAMASTSIGSSRFGREASGSVQSREEILATTGKAIADTMPFGSGLGSFVNVYRLYESPDRVTREYVVHAHNDYAELTLELGLAGALLIIAFLGWWASATAAAWRAGGGGPYARAASIASAVILVHSLVDFPLRTAAIGAVISTCLALMIDRRPIQHKESTDLRPARHIVIN
jgi:O-antigen ligase